MAIDTSTLEATLQNKFDNVTDPKEMLLLGKAYEATVGGIAVSDIEDAGAAQVATINQVATSTFKTVGGTSILGTGDIATLPSQTGNAGKVLTTDGTNASWGDSKFVTAHDFTTTTRTTFSDSNQSYRVFWGVSINKQNSNSDLHLHGHLAGRQGANGLAVYWWRVGKSGSWSSWYRCGNHTYINSYGVGQPLLGKIAQSQEPSRLTSGTVDVQIAYHTNAKPFNIWNPNGSDHSELNSGTESRLKFYEILA